jgi:hypothetical protein
MEMMEGRQTKDAILFLEPALTDYSDLEVMRAMNSTTSLKSHKRSSHPTSMLTRQHSRRGLAQIRMESA